MTTDQSISRRAIQIAIDDLEELAQAEYGLGIRDLLVEADSTLAALRVQRLTGIVLKRPFAVPTAAGYSQTGAARSWPWKDGSLDDFSDVAPNELRILNELRMPGPWQDRKPLTGTSEDRVPMSWDALRFEADHERGLFKLLALWANDKMNGRAGKTLREYVEADESRRFEMSLDLATLLFEAGVTGPLAGLLGVPTLAVGIALVGIQFGYRALTDPTPGDQGS